MEKEISETYHFTPSDYDTNGRRKLDNITFRDVIKDFERDFHSLHSTEYVLNLYANTRTMNLLARSCDADPFLIYGMNLTQGKTFDAKKDPYINHQMDRQSKYIYVYGIDSAYMTDFDEHGYPLLDESSEVFPLTLLIDESINDSTIRLAVPTTDDNNDEYVPVNINIPCIMETREDNSNWHLIRNNNGEWVSDEYAEYLSTIDAAILKSRHGNKISIQHGPDGRPWCYKHQLEELRQETMIEKPKIRKLKIKRAR